MTETERALRADILGAVARGYCAPETCSKVIDATLINAITAELLPLFNAGIAGAYAATAKHWPIVCKFEYTGCNCGWQVSDKCTMAALDQWRQHILALTPADARQASQQAPSEKVTGRELAEWLVYKHYIPAGGIDIREFLHFLYTFRTGDFRKDLEWIARKELTDSIAAAIASAEARARLEEARKWKPFKCFDVSHHPLRSPMCKTCQQMARWEERIAELEAAARTPDSTNEPE